MMGEGVKTAKILLTLMQWTSMTVVRLVFVRHRGPAWLLPSWPLIDIGGQLDLGQAGFQ